MYGQKNGVTSLIVFNKTLLASGSIDETVKIWNTKSRKLIKAFPTLNGEVFALALLDDEILAAGSDHDIKILSI